MKLFIAIITFNDHNFLYSRFYKKYLVFDAVYALKKSISTVLVRHRGVAQSGSASGLGPEGRRFKSCRPDHFMKKAKIYIPAKTSMQSGLGKLDKWIIEFETNNTGTEPLMGWESSNDTLSELKLEFSTKELAVEYAKRNKINYELIEPKKRKIVKKSYSDNFID